MYGKYELLERLGKGGMAEVYLARLAGPMGVSRYVALKRMLPDVANDRVSQMFVDEVRLAVRLTHPNIVSVYDFGLEGETYFLAMEYIDGRDVHQILKNASRQQTPNVNVEAVLYVIAQVARGLDYAHRLTDAQGRPAQIVHRDVSPANIMVTYQGDVKLADFGIARAAQHLRETHTESGEIKGKIRYMSPEQARGETLDHRTDLFALGTVLLELMTLRPAFAGESDIASLLLVQAGIPNNWEARKAMIPPDVLPVVVKAMSPDREQRFQSGTEMAEACEVVLRKRNPAYGPPQLGVYMQTMFAREHDEAKKKISAYESGAPPQVNLDSPRRNTGSHTPITPASVPGASGSTSLPGTSPPSGNGASGSLAHGEVAAPVMTGSTQRPRGPIYVGILTAGMLVTGAFVYLSRQPGGVSGVLGGAPVPPPVAAAPVQTGIPVAPAVPVTGSSTPRPGRLHLSTNAQSARVYLDRSSTERSATPVAAGGMSFKVDVPPGQVWYLRVEADGFKPVGMPLVIGPGEETTLPVWLNPADGSGVAAPPRPAAPARPSGGGPKRPAAPAAP